MNHNVPLTFLFACLFFFGLKAQKSSVQSTVVNIEKQPIVGATVWIPQDSTGVTTDKNGRFNIETESDSIVLSSFSYHKKIIFSPFPDTIYLHRIPIKEVPFIDPSISGIAPVTIVAPKYLTPRALTTIYRSQEVELPTLTLQEMYNEIPGVYMHAGALNTNRMTIRGIGSRSPFSTQKLRAFINDIPITNGIGESNLEDINLGIIDQFSIIKGPAAPEYGSALGGTILYKTDRISRSQNEVRALLEAGSFGMLRGNINANYTVGKTVFSLNQDYISSEGYRDHNQVRRYNVSAYSSTEWKEHVLTVFFNHTNLQGEIPSSLNREDFNNEPTAAAFNWESSNGNERYNRQMLGFNHTREFKEKWRTSSSVFFNRFSSMERRPFNTAEVLSNNFGGRFLLRYGLSDNGIHATGGIEYFQDNEGIDLFETIDSGKGESISLNQERRWMFNNFIVAKIPYRDYLFEIGASTNTLLFRLISDTQNSVFTFNKFYSPLFLPHLALSYRPDYDKLFYFNVSQGSSAPSLQSSQDPISFFAIDLQREVGINTEIGSRLKFMRYLELDASVYSYWVNNLVILENIGPDIFEARNAGRTWHPGIECTVRNSWILKNKHSIQVRASYQYAPHRFIRFANNTSEVDGNILPGNPQQKAFVTIRYVHPFFTTSIEQHYVGRTFANDENTIEVAPYLLSNFKIESKDIMQLLQNDARFSVRTFSRVNNIFNASYASMVAVNPSSFGGNPPRYLYPGLPRNFNVGLQIGLK